PKPSEQEVAPWSPYLRHVTEFDSRHWRRYPENMRAFCSCVLVLSIAVAALGCSKEPNAEPEIEDVEIPAVVPAPIPAPFPAPEEVRSDTKEVEAKLTPEELSELIEPSEAPPPTPADHRLHLGIDGDPGYQQDELTPEELAAARAAGAAVPQPTYAPPPNEPSRAEESSETLEDASAQESDSVYVEGTRAPVYRHRVREERREDDRREPAVPRRGRPR
ncbi:MAG: hypothetical protein WBG86_05735, partial [Polyangiales bacterium]